jgi:single stranded DNA-binding protein
MLLKVFRWLVINFIFYIYFMSNQVVTIKGKLLQSPVFVESVEGKQYAEMDIDFIYNFTNQEGVESETHIPFHLFLEEEKFDGIKDLQEKSMIETTGIYRQQKEGKDVKHVVFVQEIKPIEDKETKDAVSISVIGNLTANPEVKESQKGNSYFKIAIASDNKFKDKSDKEQEYTTFYNLLFIGDVADKNSKVKKGDFVKVLGKLQIRPYRSKSGEVKLDNTVFVESLESNELEEFTQPNEINFKP